VDYWVYQEKEGEECLSQAI